MGTSLMMDHNLQAKGIATTENAYFLPINNKNYS